MEKGIGQKELAGKKFQRTFVINLEQIKWDEHVYALIIVRDLTSDRGLLEKEMMGKLRNMMFKSFTHEIKTPLNSI